MAEIYYYWELHRITQSDGVKLNLKRRTNKLSVRPSVSYRWIEFETNGRTDRRRELYSRRLSVRRSVRLLDGV